MHLDIETPDIDTEATRLEALGATRVQDDHIHEHGSTWVLMTDPEGNQPGVAVSALADATQGGRAGSGGGFCVCDNGAGNADTDQPPPS